MQTKAQVNWVKVGEEMPPLNAPVKCQLQHWHAKGIQEHELVHVAEDDCSWRTADDNSEVSHDYNVTAWFKENSDFSYNLFGNIIAIRDRTLKVEDLSEQNGSSSYFQAWVDGYQNDGLTHNEAVQNALDFAQKDKRSN